MQLIAYQTKSYESLLDHVYMKNLGEVCNHIAVGCLVPITVIMTKYFCHSDWQCSTGGYVIKLRSLASIELSVS